MYKTKQKILTTSLELFNSKGITDVTVSNIADASRQSVSNINYHFGNKEGIIKGLLDQMIEEIDQEIFDKQELIDKGVFEYLRIYFTYQQKFKFYYLETYTIFLNYPQIKKYFYTQAERGKAVKLNKLFIIVGMGYLNPIPKDEPKLYFKLGYQIWNNLQYHPQKMWFINKEEELVKEGMKSTFYILYPYLTDSGVLALRKELNEMSV